MENVPLSLPTLAFAFSLIAAAVTVSNAVDIDVTNNAIGTSGGSRFDSDIGADYAKQVLADASSFIWAIFNQTNDGDRKNVNLITCAIDNTDGVAYTVNCWRRETFAPSNGDGWPDILQEKRSKTQAPDGGAAA